MVAARTVVYRLQADVAGFEANVRQAGSSVRKAADDMTAATREGEKFRKGLDSLGGAAGKVGLVAAAGLGAAVVKAANFDQAMSNVQAATMESAANMELLRQAALDAGADTVFSATESAAAIEELSKAGVSTADILAGGLQGALDLAAAGQLEVADAAEYTATALNQFSLQGDQATHVADLLAAGAGKAQGEVSDMANALNYAGVPAANLGVTIEETAGAVALLASNGIIGEQAGTSLRGMLASLTSPSKAAANEMQSLGIEVFDAQGKFVGFEGIAGQLQSRMSGLTDAERAYSLGKIFGNEQLQAANVLYREGEAGVKAMTAAVDDNGYAADAAATRLDNLKGDLEQLGGALETALIGTGDGSQGALRGLTQGLTRVVDVYNELPPAAKTATAAILGGSAAIGGSVWLGSKLVRGIADTREAMEQLGVAGPKATKALKGLAFAGAAAAGIATLAGALTELSNSMAETLPGMDSLQGRLIDIANAPDQFSIGLGDEFDSLGASIDRLSDPSRLNKLNDISNKINDALLPGEQFADSGSREAIREIEALDSALASLASSGNPDVAAAALERLTTSFGLSSDQSAALLDMLPQYDEALAGVANEAKLAASETSGTASAADNLGRKSQYTADQLKAMQKALDDARAEARDSATSFFNLGDALNDAEVSLGDWITKMAESADALNNFTSNSQKAAEKGLRKGLIKELQAAGEEGALRMKQLANATDGEIDRANAAWDKGKKAINRYVDATVKVPKALSTKLDVDGVPVAITNIDRIRNALAQVKDKTVTIRVTQSGTAANTPGFGPQANAAGGYITGPGTGTSDSIPSYLSNGEYVVRAAAVEKYGVHMFDRLNAMHFADGGSVDKGKRKITRGVAFYANDNTALLQQAIDRLTDASQAQTAELANATEKQEFWASKMSDLAQATVSGFNTGLFERDSNPWESGAGGGPFANLAKDIAGLQERSGLQAQLIAGGLDGDALAAALSQGSNADLTALLASGGVQNFEDMYNQRAALQGQVGQQAAQGAYGAASAAAAKDVARMAGLLNDTNAKLGLMEGKLERTTQALERMEKFAPERTGDRVGRVINDAAADGRRQQIARGGR